MIQMGGRNPETPHVRRSNLAMRRAATDSVYTEPFGATGAKEAATKCTRIFRFFGDFANDWFQNSEYTVQLS